MSAPRWIGASTEHSQRALLAWDVWQQACSIDNRNARPEYVARFLASLVDWDFGRLEPRERLSLRGSTVTRPSGDGSRLTIDQLSAAVGMTTRNIRAHQARGLLAPPVLEGRTGVYGAVHVERLLQIRRLQNEGMNLATIARVLHDGSLLRALRGPFTAEVPSEVPRRQLEKRLCVPPGSRAAEVAVELGLIEVVDETTVRVLLPSVVGRAVELVELGVPVEAQLEAVATVHRTSSEVAEAFLRLAHQHLFVQLALDADGDLAQVKAAAERLRAIAADVVQAMFLQAMADALGVVVEG